MSTQSTKINKSFVNEKLQTIISLNNSHQIDHVHDNEHDINNNYNQDKFLILNIKNQLNEFLIYLQNFYLSIDDFIIYNDNLIEDYEKIMNFINNKILLFYEKSNNFSEDDKDMIYDMYLCDIESYFLKIENYIMKFLKNN